MKGEEHGKNTCAGCIEANSNEFLDRSFLRADDNVSDVLSANILARVTV